MKKIIYFLLSILIIISLTSCAKNDIEKNSETTNKTLTEHSFDQSAAISTTEYEQATISTNTEITNLTQSEMLTKKQWTTAEIINTYKKAANATNDSAVLQQEISLTDISVNNGEGAVNSVLRMIKPIISSVVSGNSSEINGITGGYSQLVESDLKTAEAYDKDSKIIIKLTPKDQTDASLVGEHHGTVGHLISVVGDNISGVFDQMSNSGLPIEISKENISAIYVSPSVNITINENGLIENGTWKYTVTITLSNFKVSGATVNNASVTMDNVLTLNGGFSE